MQVISGGGKLLIMQNSYWNLYDAPVVSSDMQSLKFKTKVILDT